MVGNLHRRGWNAAEVFFRGELSESVVWLFGRNSFYMGKRLGCGGAFLVPQEQGYFLRFVWPQLRVAEGAIFPHHPGPLWAADDAAAFPGGIPC
jgi:hypothetical protein